MSASTTTNNDHPLREDVNERASNSVSGSSAMGHHQTKKNGDGMSLLLVENKRLRGELIELRRLLSQPERIHQEQQRPNHHNPIPPVSSSTGINNKRRDSETSNLRRQQDRSSTNPIKPAVVLEMPVTLRSNSPTTTNGRLGNTKDHQSVSTADDRETIEPHMDIESHQSASGLHHRSSHFASTSNTNTNTTDTTLSTRSTHKTRRSELLIDDEYSSSSPDFIDDTDPMAEEQGLIDSDQKRDGIMLERNEASTVADGSDPSRQMTFLQSLGDRAGWLIGLLVFQSLSSFILARNESLLQHHTVIVQFLTMLVGAGGNAGNQASVGVIRGIAVGSVSRSNAKRVLMREFAMGVALSVIIGLAGFFRAKVFAVPWVETIAITTSLFLIVVISVIVGATLPLGMEAVGIDPAHSSTTIQVVMDITGVVITVHVSRFMLDSDFHDWLADKLSVD
mmetsp:Transcript_6261/g.15497  ORF Transcript_6261/g.15497 Transcript_6261/m.15497 type:complete len:451 (-) Transcript_6261:2366-3718(-)